MYFLGHPSGRTAGEPLSAPAPRRRCDFGEALIELALLDDDDEDWPERAVLVQLRGTVSREELALIVLTPFLHS